MSNEKLISFDLKADFAFFKKPDYNVGLQLSYNMLHKPALLGILGAIVGLEGYKKKGELPAYYRQLKHLLIGVQPELHEKGNYQKASVKYTNGVGYANADGNLLVEEAMLVRPCYTCFVLLDIEKDIDSKLYHNILSQSAEFIPYLGKNEFQAWTENPTEWSYKILDKKQSFSIDSLFIKSGSVNEQVVEAQVSFDFNLLGGSFTYFERLPVGFDERLMQYQMGDFAFTDWKIKEASQIPNLYSLESSNHVKTIQLF